MLLMGIKKIFVSDHESDNTELQIWATESNLIVFSLGAPFEYDTSTQFNKETAQAIIIEIQEKIKLLD